MAPGAVLPPGCGSPVTVGGQHLGDSHRPLALLAKALLGCVSVQLTELCLQSSCPRVSPAAGEISPEVSTLVGVWKNVRAICAPLGNGLPTAYPCFFSSLDFRNECQCNAVKKKKIQVNYCMKT